MRNPFSPRSLIASSGLIASALLVGSALAAPIIVNPSFESPVIGTNGVEYTAPFGPLNGATGVPGWTFGPSDAGGTFVSFDGLSNGQTFADEGHTPPDGSQSAFVQGTGTFSQLVAGFGTGNYTLSVYAISRTNGGESIPEPTDVTIDGVPLTFGGFTSFQAITTGWGLVTSDPFHVTAGSHTLAFSGTVPLSVNDNLTGLDDVQIVPEPASISLLGLVAVGILARRKNR